MISACSRWFIDRPRVADVATAALCVLVISLYLFVFDGADTAREALQESRGPIYRSIAAVSATLLGFTMATVTLMVGVFGLERLTLLREGNARTRIVAIFFSTMARLGVTMAFAFVGLIVDSGRVPLIEFELAMFAVSVVASTAVIRTVCVLKRIVELVLRPKRDDSL